MPIRTDLWKVSASPQPLPEAQLASERKLEDMIVAAPKLADTDHFETEERSRTYGMSNKGRLLVVVPTERRDNVRIISARKTTRYEKASTKKRDQDIPELKSEQLGVGVRGKYLKHFTQGGNVVVLKPEIQKAFSTSEAVNQALARMLAFAQETQSLTTRSKRTSRWRAAV